MISKPELRRQLRARRKALTPAQRHAAAVHAAAQFAALNPRARRVAVYLEYGSELATWPLIEWLWGRGVEVYVPKMRGDGLMFFAALPPGARLRLNSSGIPEPVGRLRRRGARGMDVIVLPLLGFDVYGNRLGTGGGYYDRALAFERPGRRPLLVGYAYAVQQVQDIPAERWDVRLDAVVTEQGVTRWLTG